MSPAPNPGGVMPPDPQDWGSEERFYWSDSVNYLWLQMIRVMSANIAQQVKSATTLNQKIAN